MLEIGWTIGRHEPVPITFPLPWDELAERNRSWSFHLHAWNPLIVLLNAHGENRDRMLLEKALEIIFDWLEQFEDGGPPGSFAWYDMAVGTRADVLAGIIDAVARDRSFDDETVLRLLRAAVAHDRALADPAQFAGHNNHGLYQAAGQVALAHRLAGVPGISSPGLGRRRLKRLFATHFAPDGIHLEHSPGYHQDTLQILDAILATGFVDTPELFEARARIERALVWFVMPNGFVAMFGDTDHRMMLNQPRVAAAASTGEMAFVRSRGETGVRPGERLRAFDHGGFFVARSDWPSPPRDPATASYLAQIAGFHSRTHKHADDLSIIWYDRGAEILVDAGRYGYVGSTEPGSSEAEQGFWYSDPRRMYVESTRAHNTVQIDDTDHVRKGRKPYGSALGHSGEQDGIIFAETHVRHGHIRHARLLLFEPGEWLGVVDWLWDNDESPHRFRQWFHTAPDLEVRAADHAFVVSHPDQEWGPLHMVDLLGASAPISPIRGQEEPELQGWWSERPGRFAPNWAFGFEAADVAHHRFATLFAFGSEVQGGVSRVAGSGRTGRLSWTTDGRTTGVEFERPESGEVRIQRV